MDRSETHDMISSEKVDGTAVYGRDREKIGSVHHLMIGKRDGKVRYAVVSFGGFLGMGEDYVPLPWNELTYDEDLGGYRVNREAQSFKDAPRYGRDQEPNWDQSYSGGIDRYYGARA